MELLSSQEKLGVPEPDSDPGEKPGSRTGVQTVWSKVGQQMCSWESFGGHLASSWIVLRHVGLKAKELPFQCVAVVTRQCLKTLDGSGSLLAA